MGTSFRGAFVISWAQTEVDGLPDAPAAELHVGSAWVWSGEAVRVDGPRDVLLLNEAEGQADLHARASKMARKLVGAALGSSTISSNARPPLAGVDDRARDAHFILTNGTHRYTAIEIPTGHKDDGTPRAPLLLFVNELPPPRAELWVVARHTPSRSFNRVSETADAVICFTNGTLIDTPTGPVPVEHLGEGDLVQTKDNGPQPIVWRGGRRISGARMFAMPHLRPVRIRAHAMFDDVPDCDLLVSPDHQLVLRGAATRRLFNTPEVLVPAKELLNGRKIFIDHTVREVFYSHLMFEQHQIIWANGLEVESFHPAQADLNQIAQDQRDVLFDRFAELRDTPENYGPSARRCLSRSDVAVLSHAIAKRA